MPPAKLTGLLTVMIPEIITRIAAKENLSEYAATELFYKSKTYSLLSDEHFGLWHYSVPKLYEIFAEEQKTGNILFPEEAA
ncbi:MAG: hypothetical protein LBQ83_07595 [Candidatus Margulisbacteria bacterium]|jgi:hypothetical protein|nr:hypothetical protein [Candidatus Margulisiibacteriota bacterium]